MGGPRDYRAYGLVANFIRLTDLALNEYELARHAVHEFASRIEGIPHPAIATNHFEACIVAVKRAVGLLEAMKSSPHSPTSLKSLLPRHISVLSSGVQTAVTDMRDAIQHLDDKLRSGEISHGEPVMLAFEEDGVQLGSKTIRYTDMAAWIRNLNEVADSVARYHEEP